MAKSTTKSTKSTSKSTKSTKSTSKSINDYIKENGLSDEQASQFRSYIRYYTSRNLGTNQSSAQESSGLTNKQVSSANSAMKKRSSVMDKQKTQIQGRLKSRASSNAFIENQNTLQRMQSEAASSSSLDMDGYLSALADWQQNQSGSRPRVSDSTYRQSYAQRDSEAAGGELGTILRGLNTADVKLTEDEDELSKLDFVYKFNPTQANATAYNQKLEQLKSKEDEYNDYLAQYEAYYSPEKIAEREAAEQAQEQESDDRNWFQKLFQAQDDGDGESVNFAQRLGAMGTAAGTNVAGGVTGSAAVLGDVMSPKDAEDHGAVQEAEYEYQKLAEEKQAYIDELEREGQTVREDDPIIQQYDQQLASFEEALANTREAAEKSVEKQAKAVSGLKQASVDLAEKSAVATERALEDTSTVGGLLVNLGIAGAEMAGDALVGAATGAGSMAPMVVRVFGNTATETAQNGGTLDQQIYEGTRAAAIEWLTEKLFGGNAVYDKAERGVITDAIYFAADKLGGSEAVRKVLSSLPAEMLEEGLEEVLSDVLNPVADRLAQKAGADYDLDTDMPELETMLEDGIVGALLGLAGNVTADVSSSRQTKRAYGTDPSTGEYSADYYNKTAAAYAKEAAEIAPDDSFAQRMAQRAESGKKISGGQLGRLIEGSETALTEQDVGKIRDAAAQRLTELGETENVDTVASAIAKRTVGRKATIAEDKALASSQYGQRVVNELADTSGDFTSEWTGSIGTERLNAETYNRALENAGVEAGAETAEDVQVEGAEQESESADQSLQTLTGSVSEKTYASAAALDADDAAISAGTESVTAQAESALDSAQTASYEADEAAGADIPAAVEELDTAASDVNAGGVQTVELPESVSKNVSISTSEGNGTVTGISVTGRTASVIYKDADGEVQTEALEAADIPSENKAIIEAVVNAFGSAAPSVYAAYHDGDNVLHFLSGAREVATLAKASKNDYTYINQHMGDGIVWNYLTDGQRQIVWNAVRSAQEKPAVRANARTAVSNPGKVSTKKDVTFRGAGKSGENVTFEGISGRNLTQKQKKAVEAAGAVASVTGVDVVFFSGDGHIHGAFDEATDTIYLNIDAVDAKTGELVVMETMSHELTHFIQKEAPTEYETLKSVCIDLVLEDNGLTLEQSLREKMTRENIGYDRAMDELVADGCEKLLQNSQAAKLLAEEHRTLFGKICEWVQKFVQKLKDAFSRAESSFPEARAIMKHVSDMQTIWDMGLYAAAHNKAAGQSGGTAAAEVSGDVRFSVSQTDIQAIQSIGRKSVNDFTSEDIAATEAFARRYWQEMGVKSPFFRAWFGDWRANDSTPVQVATERGAARGKQRNDDTGWNINVSGKVFNETKAHTQSMNITAQPYLDYINDIVKKAVLLDSYTLAEGKTKSENSLMMHSFYAVADMGNGPEVLKLYVEEMNDPSSPKTGKRAYQLQNVGYQRLSAKGSGTKSLASSTSTADIRSVADLFAAVKEKDANFNPKPVSKVVNEDGTPTVVYRGGRKGITAFDGERTGGGNDQYGSGFYFATDRETADTYAGEGGETLATYLNIQNPITVTGDSVWTEDGLHLSRKTIADIIKKAPGIMDVDESPMGDFYDIWSEGITEAMFTDVAEAYVGNSIFTIENDFFRGHSAAFRKAVYDMTGYDGVVKTFSSGEKFYVAWFPNQIKHATENRGTFDTETDNIRFSVQSQEADSTEDIEKRLQASEREAARLQRKVDYYQRQTKRTKPPTAKGADVKRLARSLQRSYSSTVDMTQALTEVADHIIQVGADKVSGEYVTMRVRQIAAHVIDHAEVTVDPNREARQQLTAYLKETPLAISQADRHDIPDFNRWRQANPHIIRVNQTGKDIGQAYTEDLQAMFGTGLFPDDITAPSDQLLRIREVYDALKAQKVNPFEGRRDAALEAVTSDIVDGLFGVRQDRTFADRKADEIARIRAEKNAKIADIRKSGRDDLAKLRAEKNTQIAAAKREGRETLAQYRASRAERDRLVKYRSRVEKVAWSMRNKLLRNNDKSHVPEPMKRTVGALLDTIDFTSPQQLSGGEMTVRDKRYTKAMDQLRQVLARQQGYQENPEQDAGGDMGIYLDLPAGFTQRIQEHINWVERLAEAADAPAGTSQVYLMDAAELKELAEILTAVNHSITAANQLYLDGHRVELAEIGDETIRELDRRTPHKQRKADDTRGVGSFLEWDNTTPYYAFKRMGPAGTKIFNILQSGWDKLAFNAREIIDYTKRTYTPQQVKEWANHRTTFSLDSGEQAGLTDTQIMSLYCLSKRRQAVDHLLGGGMRVGTTDTKEGVLRQTVPFVLTEGDIAAITGTLDAEQIRVANALQDFMNTVGTRWGNEVSMTRFGYRAFTEENYFPITSEPTNLRAVDPDARANDMFRLLNMSFTKSLTDNANNAIVVSDIFDVYSSHMADMAKYNALAVPVLDVMKWYNYKDTTEYTGPDGETKVCTDTVQRSIQTALGDSANRYITTFIKDLNGAQDGGRGEGFYSKLLGNYKVAAVGANLRVAMLQPTAYVRAGAILSPAAMTKALTMSVKTGISEMLEYSGIAVWKDLGYYDTNIGRSMKEQIKGDETVGDKLREGSMFLAEWGDKITWGCLWNACKTQARTRTGVTEENLMDETAKLFREVVYATQVVDSTMTRSQLMRSSSAIDKTITSFGSEPTLSYNLLLDAYNTYEDAKRAGDKQAWVHNRGKITRALLANVATILVSAAVESLSDAVRDDDDYETFWQKVLEAFGGWDGNLASDMNPLSMIPIARDIVSMLQGYDNSRLDLEFLKNALKFSEAAEEYVRVEILGTQEKYTDATYYGKMTGYGIIYTGLKFLSQATGLPASNFARDTVAIYNSTIGQITGSTLKTYEPSPETAITDAMEAGYLTHDDAVAALMEDADMTEEDAESRVTYMEYQQKYPDATMTEDKYTAYLEYADGVVDVETADALYAVWKNTQSDPEDMEGGQTKKEKVMEIIDEMNLTDNEKDALYLMFWSEKTIDEAPWR